METNEVKEVVNKPATAKNKKGFKTEKSAAKYKVDEATENLVKKIKFNADIRHFVALSIVKYLKEGKVYPQDAKLFVSFYWNKFTVNNGGFNTDYPYDTAWVLGAINNGINDAIDNIGEALKSFGIEKDLIDIK